MNFSQQLKKYRLARGFSQEELAEKLYVTRQTISKWENDKTYPDIHNLIALSILFDVTLDELIKGDVVTMKQNLKAEKMKQLSWVMIISLSLMMFSLGPVLLFLDWYGLIIPFALWVIGMVAALKIEKIKKNENLQTYAEIIAYTEGRDLASERLKRNKNKDSRNKAFLIIAVAVVFLGMAVVSIYLSSII